MSGAAPGSPQEKPDPLDRIEEKARIWMRHEQMMVTVDRALAQDIAALVEVARAARDAQDHAQDYWDWVTHHQPKVRASLARLDNHT